MLYLLSSLLHYLSNVMCISITKNVNPNHIVYSIMEWQLFPLKFFIVAFHDIFFFIYFIFRSTHTKIYIHMSIRLVIQFPMLQLYSMTFFRVLRKIPIYSKEGRSKYFCFDILWGRLCKTLRVNPCKVK